MNKKNVLILFGGESNEHEISCKSAANIISCMDKEKYDAFIVGITKEGKWYLVNSDIESIKNGNWVNEQKTDAFLSPSKSQGGLVILDGSNYTVKKIDVCFPVLHGLFGEDGTVQGLLKLAGIPCVGGGPLSMGITMDKRISKIVFEHENIPVVPTTYIDENYDIESLKNELSFPVFIKPANSGSSVGCHKVDVPEELESAVKDALKTDSSVLAEKYIDCREVEFAVLGNDDPFVSMPGEITTQSTFYDYETKYIKTQKVNITAPAPVQKDLCEKMKKYAVKAYKAVGLSGMARADFFIDKKTNEIYLNEFNSIPGFTATSMYPFLMEKHGISGSELFDKLINLAIRK